MPPDESEDKHQDVIDEIRALRDEVRFLMVLVTQARDASIGTEIAIERIRDTVC
jgi:hypothetical protein